MVSRKELIDAPERRMVAAAEFELRAKGNDSLTLTGYASVFNAPYTVSGGPPHGWVERVDPGAFKETLSKNPDLHLLVNHEGLPLARTKSGTLKVGTDSKGLLVEADLAQRDPDVQRLQTKMERGDLDEMSFAFRTKQDEWRDLPDGGEERSLLEVSLHKGDVSVVNWGANPATSVQLRSIDQALEMLAASDRDMLKELRAMRDGDLVVRAYETLRDIMELRRRKTGRLSLAEARAVESGVMDLRATKPDGGGVDYADPGYQKDGKKRYPIDTADHVRAAWSYINQSDNAGMYSAEQLANIKGRIKSAAKKFGIQISDS